MEPFYILRHHLTVSTLKATYIATKPHLFHSNNLHHEHIVSVFLKETCLFEPEIAFITNWWAKQH